ncbi:MAG: hypothetical protein HOO96_18810 [Polyangiaceae bacterium]|nr:hypothetical protein [Polyangiaceae bacterium]
MVDEPEIFTPSSIIAMGFFAIVVTGVVGYLVLVLTRPGRDRQHQARQWMAFAHAHRGQFIPGSGVFGGNRIVVHQSYWQVVLETVTVSIMDAVRSGYFPDGGTYTVAKVRYHQPRGRDFKLSAGQVRALLTENGRWACQHLPAEALVVSSAHEGVVVMPGTSAADAQLWAAVTIAGELASLAA